MFRGFFLFVLHYRKHLQVLEARLIRTCRLHHTLTSFASLYLWPCSNIRWSSMQSVFFQHQLQFLSRISYSTVRRFKVIEVMVHGYFQLPVHPNIQSPCAIISDQVQHGLLRSDLRQQRMSSKVFAIKGHKCSNAIFYKTNMKVYCFTHNTDS